MKCKQGDLAIVTKANPTRSQFIGMIVKCVALADIAVPAWETEPPIVYKGKTLFAEDEALTPIRGDLLNDELTTSKELETV